jgi:L-iditol 2-dehydrogenase
MDEVRLRVDLAGLCSTDRHIYQGHFAVPLPRVLGHELVGTVDAIGPGGSPDWLGQICGVSPARFCGECPACRRGYPECCANFACLGNTRDGGLAEYTLVPADQLLRLNGLSPEVAVWLEPLACVLHAIQAGNSTDGDKVLVIGAGVLGKLAVMALKATASLQVAVADPNPSKIEQALVLGAQVGWDIPRTGPAPEISNQIHQWAEGGPEVIIDTSGSSAALDRAMEWSGVGTRIVLFGVSDPGTRICLSPRWIMEKEILLTAVAGMTPGSFAQAEELLRSERIDPRKIPSIEVDLPDVPGILADGTIFSRGKILVRPGRKP